MNKIFLLIFIFFIFLFNQILRLNANDDTYINSSNITYNEKENIIELAENSKINFKNINILTDKGIIDYNKNEFEVFGDFYLYEELTILSGQNLKGNINLDTFSANNVSYIYSDNLKIDSDKLKRENNFLYFYNNFLTPCELEGYFNCPTWSLRIDESKYNIEEDKFTHFDSFLQIADYKVFYLPYFTHYGQKAPRQKGFLTPSLQFSLVGGGQSLIIPYYIPLNDSTDLTLKPKISLTESFEVLEQYELKTILKNKSSGGKTTLEIDTIKKENSVDINNSLRIQTTQVLDRKNIITASGLFTNSISTTRSNNEEPVTFEDILIKHERYNFISNNDYLKSEIYTVKSFDFSNISLIPLSPSINYFNTINFRNHSLVNELDFLILKRDESGTNIPSESLKLNIKNELINNNHLKGINFFNKLIFANSISSYYFNKENTKDHDSFKSSLILSHDLYFNKFKDITPRLKVILPLQINNTDKLIVEDSGSITFNYQNQYSENRFFGNDILDNSPRLVYGIENEINYNENKISFKLNQSYEINENSSYAEKVNQKSNFSDIAFEMNTRINDINFQIDTRFDNKNLSKREMNYSLNLKKPINISINFHETQSKAFKELSNDTQSLDFQISKEINENISFVYQTDLDVKNNYDPYKSSFKLSLFDECSQFDITYSNTRFNDNFNTSPEETIGFTFSMDYLGFFGYKQSTDLFFKEPGNLDYGL